MSAFILVHEPASLLLVVAQAVLEKVQLALTGTDKKKKREPCTHARLSAARKFGARKRKGCRSGVA